MKFEILQENLNNVLSQALKFISPKAQLPVLGNFLICAKNGILSVSATDMESSIILRVGAKVENDGEVLVSAKIFSEFIFSLSAGKIEAEEEDGFLVVKLGKTKAKFSTMPTSEFPKTEDSENGGLLFEIDQSLLERVSERLPFAVSQDMSRPTMTGIYFENKEKKMSVVSTDGFRLSLFEEQGGDVDFSVNVPAKIIEELGKIAGKEKSGVEMFLNKTKTAVVFKIKETEISSRLIEGQYPPYRKIIPADHSIGVVLDRQELLKAVKTASIFAKDVSCIVKLSFQGNSLKISSSTESVGENENEIECEKQGEDLEISFNFKYLLEILSRLSGKEVFFETEGPNRPCVFREKESPSFLHLIMPVKKN